MDTFHWVVNGHLQHIGFCIARVNKGNEMNKETVYWYLLKVQDWVKWAAGLVCFSVIILAGIDVFLWLAIVFEATINELFS